MFSMNWATTRLRRRAQDKAGNVSEEISRVALRDGDFVADAGVRVTHGTGGTIKSLITPWTSQ